jgi:hypothetical protein
MMKRRHFLFLIILLSAIALTFFKIPLASSQGLSVVANWVDGDLPVEDPASAVWQAATAVDVPLSAQNITKPYLLDTRVKSVTARALQNASQIAILVEWADDTQDDSTVAIQDFRDAAALQFPQVEGQPYFCMGQQGGNVNLWHWKADWQAEIAARQEMETQYPDMSVDYYPYAEVEEGQMAGLLITPTRLPAALQAGNEFAALTRISPVEDLIAGGFGTLTSQPVEEQNVQGYGVWKDGQWQVIFSRELASTEPDDVTFLPGKTYSVAFAVWDGANEERNGQKSTSQWVSLQLLSAPGSAVTPAPEATEPEGLLTTRNITILMFGVLIVLLIIGGFIYSRLPE